MTAIRLGASLYVPCTHTDLPLIATGTKLKDVRSVIFCLEDSVSEKDLEGALANLQHVLKENASLHARMNFVRPRNADVLKRVLAMDGVDKLTGFVIPKSTVKSFPAYLKELAQAKKTHFKLMPTLETKEVFDAEEMRQLHDLLSEPEIFPQILALRIGGNDLLNALGLRRSRHRTIYDSPIGLVISQLVGRFKPSGFHLTSPVCEHLYDHEVLERELVQDLEYGLIGKTAIHPDQVSVIEKFYQPTEQDLRMAHAILAPDAPAVFNMCGTMCEVATHSEWAKNIKERSLCFGVYGKEAKKSPLVLVHST
ncbi:HpcH/HpaI aldolase/citrate lyase family protein [Nostoc sp. CHAB 5834]|nr:HpcH/HpaI aldolase/citrate lyase family protein [Nostoc sp. CHAB 5834]